MTPNDRICQAIAGHYKNGTKLECGSEYSELLFPFGNKRAVSRHVNKGGPETYDVDRKIALSWVESQPESHKKEILMLLGLADKEAEAESSGVKKEAGVKKQEETMGSPVSVKRKYEEVDEVDSKVGVVCQKFISRPNTDKATDFWIQAPSRQH
jgi:hypothetical protein